MTFKHLQCCSKRLRLPVFRYSFQGFRYIRLTEFPDTPVDLSCFTAIAVHSEMKRTGAYVCGNEKINQLYHNIVWGQKGNYLDIPTDCPQRDERLGWTGDAQVFCRTAAINYDVEDFFRKWLRDVMLEQEPSGAVRGIVPDAMPSTRPTRISAAWLPPLQRNDRGIFRLRGTRPAGA